MRCADVAEVLGEYLDGTLDAKQVKLLEAHLRSCLECQVLLAQYRRTVEMCESLEEEEVPQSFRAALMSRVAAAQEDGGAPADRLFPRRWAWPRLTSVYRGVAAVGFALVLMVSGAVIYQSPAVQALVLRHSPAAVADNALLQKGQEGESTGSLRSRSAPNMTATGSPSGNVLVGAPGGGSAVSSSFAISVTDASGSPTGTLSETAPGGTSAHGLGRGVDPGAAGQAPGPSGGLTIAAANEESTKNAVGRSTDIQRKIVYSASLRLDTEDFNKTYNSIISITEAAQGYVERSDYSTPGTDGAPTGQKTPSTGVAQSKRGLFGSAPWPNPPVPVPPPEKINSLTLRVPSNSFPTVLSQIEDLGSVKARHVYSRDVTEDYIDVDGRLAAANVHEARLLEILGQAKSVEDILKVETELEKVRATVEVLTRQLRNLSNQVSYSTIVVELHEARPNPFGPEGPQGVGGLIGDTFWRSIDGLVRLGLALVIFLAAALPWLALLAAAALIARYLWKRYGKRSGTGARAQ